MFLYFWHSEDFASWHILIIKANEMHYFSTLFCKELYMFRTDLLSIIRSLNTLFTAIGICHTGYVDCLLARSGWNIWCTVCFNKCGSAWNFDRPTIELGDGLQLTAEDLVPVSGWVELVVLVPDYCDLVSRFTCLIRAGILTSSHEV
jgi:hypothetical protein